MNITDSEISAIREAARKAVSRIRMTRKKAPGEDRSATINEMEGGIATSHESVRQDWLHWMRSILNRRH